MISFCLSAAPEPVNLIRSTRRLALSATYIEPSGAVATAVGQPNTHVPNRPSGGSGKNRFDKKDPVAVKRWRRWPQSSITYTSPSRPTAKSTTDSNWPSPDPRDPQPPLQTYSRLPGAQVNTTTDNNRKQIGLYSRITIFNPSVTDPVN